MILLEAIPTLLLLSVVAGLCCQVLIDCMRTVKSMELLARRGTVMHHVLRELRRDAGAARRFDAAGTYLTVDTSAGRVTYSVADDVLERWCPGEPPVVRPLAGLKIRFTAAPAPGRLLEVEIHDAATDRRGLRWDRTYRTSLQAGVR